MSSVEGNCRSTEYINLDPKIRSNSSLICTGAKAQADASATQPTLTKEFHAEHLSLVISQTSLADDSTATTQSAQNIEEGIKTCSQAAVKLHSSILKQDASPQSLIPSPPGPKQVKKVTFELPTEHTKRRWSAGGGTSGYHPVFFPNQSSLYG